MSGMLSYHDLTYKVLGQILRVGVRPIAWSAKALATAVIESFDKEIVNELNAQDKDVDKEVRRLIYYSKRKGYLNSHLQTTRTGAERLKKLDFKYIQMNKPWDNKWRVVMYDIPEEKRNARDQIRRLITQLGFVQLQRSVWVHPLPCLDQFDEIKHANGLGNSLVLIETENIAGVEKYKQHFRNLYPGLKL